jgi:RNA polymerase sigma-70 factor (ECF subfamily)
VNAAPSDEEIMMEAARGSMEAFEEIVRRYQARLLRFFSAAAGDRETARDLTQECFLRLLRSARRYEPRATFRTFLFTIARRLAFDEKAKAWSRREAIPEELPSAADGPDRETEKKRMSAWLSQALLALPPKEREAIVLSESAGLSYREIAALVGCPEGTVASRKNRALRLLRAHASREPL